VDCYLAEARGTDLRAEIALYEVARLRRDALSDPAGALGALREHRRRFPAGALSTEIELSIAELLPRLRRYREALDQTSALLGAHPRGERAGELYLLRGHVLREGFGDWAGAEQAYAAAAAAAAPGGGARAADPASFWRAVCLEKMGRREEASQAYRRYLARARGAHAGEATRRLEALDRAP
jgi:tetratricopeptide (TPR) repeat protein